MRRTVLFAIAILLVSLPVAALEWEEIGGTANIVSDYDTGLPAIVFNTGISYDVAPELMRLRFTWQVFSIDGEAETMLYEYTKTTRLREGTHRIWSASQSVVIEPGGFYGARVWIDDLENDLSYTRAYTYIAPHSLPVGLRLVGWDGSEEADLTGLPDDELGELARLYGDLSTAEVVAENVSLSDVFSLYAANEDAYPVTVVLLPETGVNSNWGSESQPITATFGLCVFVYTLPSTRAVPGFQEQAALYDQTFIGTVYSGIPGTGLGQGTLVFVHDAMQLILNAAVQELEARSE